MIGALLLTYSRGGYLGLALAVTVFIFGLRPRVKMNRATLGAYVGAALVGLGLAQAQPYRTVVVITGDGEQLMGLGGLATIGVAKPKNLVIVVIDNNHFGETGM